MSKKYMTIIAIVLTITGFYFIKRNNITQTVDASWVQEHAQREPGSIRVREFSGTTARNLAIELEDFMNRNNITEERIIDIQYSVSMTSNRNGTSERHFAIIIFR